LWRVAAEAHTAITTSSSIATNRTLCFFDCVIDTGSTGSRGQPGIGCLPFALTLTLCDLRESGSRVCVLGCASTAAHVANLGAPRLSFRVTFWTAEIASLALA